MKIIVTEIQWDTDGMNISELPSTVKMEVPENENIEDFTAEKLSNDFNFLVIGFNYRRE